MVIYMPIAWKTKGSFSTGCHSSFGTCQGYRHLHFLHRVNVPLTFHDIERKSGWIRPILTMWSDDMLVIQVQQMDNISHVSRLRSTHSIWKLGLGYLCFHKLFLCFQLVAMYDKCIVNAKYTCQNGRYKKWNVFTYKKGNVHLWDTLIINNQSNRYHLIYTFSIYLLNK